MKDRIDAYMATTLVTFSPGDSIIDAMRVLLERHLSGAPVVDEHGSLVGILSKKDCLAIVYRAAYHQDPGGTVEQYMNHEVEYIEAGCSVVEVVEKFLNSNFRCFPVLRGDQLVGLISRQDVLRALYEQFLKNA